jgi:hypothetical protein
VLRLRGLDKYPLLLEPLLFYVLHRECLDWRGRRRPQLKLFVLDEAWRFARTGRSRRHHRGAGTWRKRMPPCSATQQRGLCGSGLLYRRRELLDEAVSANPSMDLDRARTLFIQLHGSQPHHPPRAAPADAPEAPDVSKVLNLHVDPNST